MEYPKTYNHSGIEDKWYKHWISKGYFNSSPNEKEAYTIVIPPPNVTGVLHMGHMLNNTIQDVLIRKARMDGKNACWVPGTDHASIATEAKVVKLLAEQGISKNEIGRKEFLKHAWEWKEKYGGIILQQLQKLGCSCDWDRTKFTLEPQMNKSVVKVFNDLYKKGYIYRGTKMVNWDPVGKTTLSDEEVIFKELNSKFYYIKYKIKDSEDYLTIATVRPETIMGDVAVCCNPNDERYKHLKGKSVIVPMINKEVPIIFDEHVDLELGTGILKITPAHDLADYEIGLKYKLDVIDCLNEDGTISDKAGLFVGLDRFKARKEAVKLLEKEDLLIKIEDYKNSVGHSERTNAVIEPRISTQWFVNMQKYMKNNPAILDDVMSDDIQLLPKKFKNTYRHWMENVKDWNISRQLWWGHRIPAYYSPDGTFFVAESIDDAAKQAIDAGKIKDITELKQDEDVLDTWFSSWLWPISVFNGILEPNNKEIKYYYPTNVLVTGPDIIFFWVARMVMAGFEFRDKKPFNDVYFTGLIRDEKGRKMSKSLGNSPDALALISQYGADAVRMGLLLSSPAGNDLLYNENLIHQGRNFGNKMWNAFRLVSSWEDNKSTDEQPAHEVAICNWFEAKLDNALQNIELNFGKYRLSDSLMAIYKLFWDDYCSWYLEMIKPGFDKQMHPISLSKSLNYFTQMLKILHPFNPFITEELYHFINPESNTDITISNYPKVQNLDTANDSAIELITALRGLRNEKKIGKDTLLNISIKANDATIYKNFTPVITKMTGLESISFDVQNWDETINILIGTDQITVNAAGLINKEEEVKNAQVEINRLNGFLKSINAKLNNERFVANAKPEIVDREKQKQADALNKIERLKAVIEGMG